MQQTHLVLGRIVPERMPFGHNGLRLYVKDSVSGVDICLLFGVIDNQLTAKIIGDVSNQSNVFLKNLVIQAEHIVLNAVTFTTGKLLDVDIVGVLRDSVDATDGSFEFHYMDLVHDCISKRTTSVTLEKIYQIGISDEGISLCRCLNDLRNGLREINDTPFYCYRAIETIKAHFDDRCGFGGTKGWDAMRDILGVDREDIMFIKNLSDPLRHGRSVRFKGEEWLKIIQISWNVTEAYIHFLSEVLSGARAWPQGR